MKGPAPCTSDDDHNVDFMFRFKKASTAINLSPLGVFLFFLLYFKSTALMHHEYKFFPAVDNFAKLKRISLKPRRIRKTKKKDFFAYHKVDD